VDIQILLFLLALGHLILALAALWSRAARLPGHTLWLVAQLLQGSGWLFLAGHGILPDALALLCGYAGVLCGLAYECWAVRYLIGQPLGRARHLGTAAVLLVAVAPFAVLSPTARIALFSLIVAWFLVLLGVALRRAPGANGRLPRALGAGALAMSGALLLYAASAAEGWETTAPRLLAASGEPALLFGAWFALLLLNGLGMLWLSHAATERALRRALAEQKTIFRAAPCGLAIVRERVIERCNPALEAMSGHAPGTLAGQSLRCFYASDADYAAHGRTSAAAVRTTGRFDGELEWTRRDGTRFWVQAQATALFPKRAWHYALWSVVEITAHRQRQEIMARARDRAETSERAQSQFLAHMSHEMRTPLNAMLGFTQLLARDPTLGAIQREQVHIIARGGDHLLTLLDDVLDLARIEAGRMTLQPEPFDLPAFLDETLAFFRPRARARGLRLDLVAADIPRWVTGDALKLRQVLFNLLGNALKFTLAGGVTLRIDATAAPQWRFEVTDTGIGIAPEELRRLFQPFVQIASGRSNPHGTGLGLALSAQLVGLLGGRLQATSVPNVGSRFFFTVPLPATAAPEAHGMAAPRSIIGLEPGQPARRFLIVDVLDEHRALIHALLSSLEVPAPAAPLLEIREARDGDAALALWESWQPHAMFLEVRLPGRSGIETARAIKTRLRARPAAMPTAIMALSTTAEHSAPTLAAGCDDFARKPFQLDELVTFLERHVQLRMRRRAVSPECATLTPREVAARLAAGPGAWRQALRQAIAVGDFARIETLLAETDAPLDAALRATLTRWAANYDLDAFVQALAPDA